MGATSATAPRAFAVSFKDFHRWDFGYFRTVAWRWPSSSLHPLGTILLRKESEVPATLDKQTVPIIGKISFGGKVTLAALDERASYKGRLYWADKGDLIYSKIRVKQGSLAVVPSEFDYLAVSAEYPVYKIDEQRVDSTYLSLVLKSKPFLALLEGLSHGGSTKTRIPPAEFERQLIPLPPLRTQETIVARWRKAQDEIDAARKRVEKHISEIQIRFLSDLGLKSPTLQQQPRAFAVLWRDLFALSARATFLSGANNSLNLGKYPVVLGRDCLCEVRHGCSASPSPKPTNLEVLKISAVTRGVFNPMEKKFALDNVRARAEFALNKGDVLLCRTNGTLAYVGMSAMVLEDMPNLIFPDKVIRVRVGKKIVPEFLWQVLQSHPLRAQIEAAARTAVGNYAIGTEDIWRLKIPLPPLPVQEKIMEQVAAGRAEIAREREAAEHLAKSIHAEIEALILGTRSVKDA